MEKKKDSKKLINENLRNGKHNIKQRGITLIALIVTIIILIILAGISIAIISRRRWIN